MLGLALNPPADAVDELVLEGNGGPLHVRTVWLVGAVVLGALLFVAVALVVPRKGVSPFWSRALDLGERAVLLSLVPLCLAVLDLYAAARGITGG